MKPFSISLALLVLLTGCQSTSEKEAAPPPMDQGPGAQPSAGAASSSGTMSTASGLQYRVLTSGPSSGHSPGPSDSVTVHYRGELIDGTVFDSSYDRGEPATFGVGQVIQGWTEALQLMKPGDKWLLCIPPHLAYGSQGMGGKIPPNSTLIFQVELLSVAGR